MKVLIVEDELPAARRLERLLQQHEVEILATFNSIKATVAWFQKNESPDIIFLDIQLSDGLCFEIFEQTKITSKIIFVTAFSDYSIKAFDYNSISYLLKPINKDKLKGSILKAEKGIHKENELEQFRKLFEKNTQNAYKESFTVKVGNKIKIIKSPSILYFYSYDNATFIQNHEGSYIINHSLTDLENEIDPSFFFRINRSYLINQNSILDIFTYKTSRLKLKLKNGPGNMVIVSRDKVKAFKNWIND